jgi:hypothetical protein
MALKTTRWDVADILKTKEAIAAYLDAALENGDPELLKDALGAIARSKGMTEIAKEAGPWPVEPLQGAVAGRQPGVRDGCQRPQGAGAQAFRRTRKRQQAPGDASTPCCRHRNEKKRLDRPGWCSSTRRYQSGRARLHVNHQNRGHRSMKSRGFEFHSSAAPASPGLTQRPVLPPRSARRACR